MFHNLRASMMHLSVLALFSCASASLELELSIYDEDPKSQIPISQQRLDAIGAELHEAREIARHRAEARYAAAESMVRVYSLATVLRAQETATANPDAVRIELQRKPPASLLPAFKDALRHNSAATIARIDNALTRIIEYERVAHLPQRHHRASLGNTASTLSEHKVAKAKSSLQEALQEISEGWLPLSESMDTEFEHWVADNWSTVESAIGDAQNARALIGSDVQDADVQELLFWLEECRQSLQRLEALGEDEPLALRFREAALTGDTGSIALKDAFSALSIETLLLHGFDNRPTVGTFAKNNSLLFSQIDRLQDPADPVWRVVSDPRNRHHWNSTFSRTYFYAEGNSSVVVVRDTPMDFRVQRGDNNPTALVNAQLQVSRAVGDAAIRVANSAAGASPLGGASTHLGGNEEDQKIAKQNAANLVKRRQNLSAQRILRAQLESINESVAGLDPTQPEDQKTINALKIKLQGILRATSLRFADTSTPNPAVKQPK